MSKRYLSELKDQLAMVKQHLAAIHVPQGPLAPPMPAHDRERRGRLLARKRDLEEKIIWYEPEREKRRETERPIVRSPDANTGAGLVSGTGVRAGPPGKDGEGNAGSSA